MAVGLISYRHFLFHGEMGVYRRFSAREARFPSYLGLRIDCDLKFELNT